MDNDMATRFRSVSTPHVCDALEHIGIDHTMLTGLHRVTDEGVTMAGPAVTIELTLARTKEAPRRMGKFLDEVVTPGSVLVIAAHGVMKWVTVGGRASARARSKGAVGAVVDGGVRDVPELQGADFPVFARGFGLHSSEGRLEGIRINETVCCGGVKVDPGDWVVADDTGVIVVPSDVAEQVCDLAVERDEIDVETMVEITTKGASIEASHRHFKDDDVEWMRRVE
jgi:4-hydroxy-4-methyl-2-oxoglutarate aldolase